MPKPRSLCVVEDNSAFSAVVATEAGRQFEVQCMSNGNELLRAIETGANPSAVILDLQMPQINGLELMRKLRAMNYQAPIVVMTGYSTPESLMEAWSLGAVDYLQKPFDLTRFRQTLDRITAILEKDALLREMQEQAARLLPLARAQMQSMESRAFAAENALFRGESPYFSTREELANFLALVSTSEQERKLLERNLHVLEELISCKPASATTLEAANEGKSNFFSADASGTSSEVESA